jgi:DNA-binding response OmpR family regulator
MQQPDPLYLTPNERRVLALLVRRAHVSPPQIMIHLYAAKPTCDQPLETPERQSEMLINRIRRKMPSVDIRTTDAGWSMLAEHRQHLRRQRTSSHA